MAQKSPVQAGLLDVREIQETLEKLDKEPGLKPTFSALNVLRHMGIREEDLPHVRILWDEEHGLNVLSTKDQMDLMCSQVREVWAGWVPLVEIHWDEGRGVTLSNHSDNSLSKRIRGPLIHVLGEALDYDPGNSISPNKVYTRVLRLSGVDPSNLPDGMSLEDRNGKRDGLKRLVRRIFYNLGPKGDKGMTILRDGGWSLTRKGVQESIRLRSIYSSDKRNITTWWIDRWIDKEQLAWMERQLSLSFPRSRDCQEIRELIHNHLVNLMARDSLKNRILSENLPTRRQLLRWTARSAMSTWRKEGKDALTRECKGALTERDRNFAKESESPDGPKRNPPSDYVMVTGITPIYAKSEEGDTPLLDVSVGIGEEEAMIHNIAKREGLRLIEKALRRHKAGSADRFAERILHYYLNDYSYMDVAEAEGVSRNRAATLMADLRSALRKAREAGEQATEILGYISQEPFATLDDLSEDLGDEYPLDFLLDVLVETGRLKESQGSYNITPRGRGYLEGAEENVARLL